VTNTGILTYLMRVNESAQTEHRRSGTPRGLGQREPYTPRGYEVNEV